MFASFFFSVAHEWLSEQRKERFESLTLRNHCWDVNLTIRRWFGAAQMYSHCFFQMLHVGQHTAVLFHGLVSKQRLSAQHGEY